MGRESKNQKKILTKYKKKIKLYWRKTMENRSTKRFEYELVKINETLLQIERYFAKTKETDFLNLYIKNLQIRLKNRKKKIEKKV